VVLAFSFSFFFSEFLFFKKKKMEIQTKEFDTLEDLFQLEDIKQEKYEYNEFIIPICQVFFFIISQNFLFIKIECIFEANYSKISLILKTISN
jgi:hypothetical protein